MKNIVSLALFFASTLCYAQQQKSNTAPTSNENTEQLEEVLVTSASRETQKRSEVPGSIAILNTQTIEETKAFGIDQLVNQVPGVFMATSRAASNEQHFMAARSPITTKGLFLYLEDGLAIRPTSVFNHNALLEMNDTSFGRIEVLKGPASSIYGSEAIGGSFNFITKNPTEELSGSVGFQTNTIGLSRYDVELANQVNARLGFYLGGHFVKRKDGPIAHSDYEKFALTFKSVYDIMPKTKLTSVLTIIDYRSDMSGSLSEADYSGGNFESDQTFTAREAVAFRFRNTLNHHWNTHHKTSFNVVFRENRMDQNPSYRVRQFQEDGVLTGFGSGELNTNQFNSWVGLLQHKMNFDVAGSSLIFGGMVDFSPQRYLAETLDVVVDPITGQNIDFTINKGDYILNYEADIFNYASFFQYEIAPIPALKITAALRYDGFQYHYDNLAGSEIGIATSQDMYSNWAPKLGANYNFNAHAGIYANYASGFSPPQVATLYRNSNDLVGIQPSSYDNFELGGYFAKAAQWKFDIALYLLEGKNTLITLRDAEDNFYNTNAGKTQSYGVEYGITYHPIPALSLAHSGSYAQHRYVSFFDGGIDYSDTDRETAPNLLGTSTITYQKKLPKGLGYSLAASHELMGAYTTSFEGQVTHEDGSRATAVYDGHSIFNLRASLTYKSFEIWGHALNVFDELYAARASYNQFRNENSYTIGNPRTLHLGVRYNF